MGWKKTKSRASVEVANGGYIVSQQDGRYTLFVGRDGYWTRVKQAASPFKIKGEADAFANDLNDPRSGKWE